MTTTPKATLLVRGGPEDGTTFGLSDGLTIIGRDSTNDIVVNEPGVSRQHAAIRGSLKGYWIEDLNSQNGTSVNGSPVRGEGRRLHNKDLIKLGGSAVNVHWLFNERGATVIGRSVSDT